MMLVPFVNVGVNQPKSVHEFVLFASKIPYTFKLNAVAVPLTSKLKTSPLFATTNVLLVPVAVTSSKNINGFKLFKTIPPYF